MKKIFTFLLVLSCLKTFSQWQVVGQKKFTPVSQGNLNLKLGSNETPYVAFKDGSCSGKATVMKFDQNNWVFVGAQGFSVSNAKNLKMVIDKNDHVFVAYNNPLDSNKIMLHEYDGTTWKTHNKLDLALGISPYSFDMALDTNGFVHIGLVRLLQTPGQRILVKKYLNNSWQDIPNNILNSYYPINVKMEFDNNNNLFLAIENTSGSPPGRSIYLYKYNGAWNYGVHTAYYGVVWDLEINSANVPYISKESSSQLGYYTGEISYLNTGSAGNYFFIDTVKYAPLTFNTSITLDGNNNLFYAYHTPHSNIPGCYSCYQIFFQQAGSGIIEKPTLSSNGYQTIEAYKAPSIKNGNIYLAFVDTGNIPKISVLRRTNPTGLSEIKDNYISSVKVYPNPGMGLLTINCQNTNEKISLRLFNLQGMLIKQYTLQPVNNEYIVQLEGLAPGAYFYQLLDGDKNLANGKYILLKE